MHVIRIKPRCLDAATKDADQTILQCLDAATNCHDHHRQPITTVPQPPTTTVLLPSSPPPRLPLGHGWQPRDFSTEKTFWACFAIGKSTQQLELKLMGRFEMLRYKTLQLF